MNDRPNGADDSSQVDLGALDPDLDPYAADRFASTVMSRIARSTSLPSVPLDPLFGLWSLAPAILIAASIVLVVTIGTQRGHQRNVPPTTIAEAVGVPADYLAVGAPQPSHLRR